MIKKEVDPNILETISPNTYNAYILKPKMHPIYM